MSACTTFRTAMFGPSNDPAEAYGPQDPDLYRQRYDAFGDSHSFVIAPRAELELRESGLIPAKETFGIAGWNDSDDGTIGYYVLGSIRYHDVFAGTLQHLTKFCYKVTSNGERKPRTAICSHWNCVEAQCDRDRE